MNLLIAMLLSTGCQYNSVPKNDHEKSKPTPPAPQNMVKKSVDEVDAQKYYQLAKSLQNKGSDKKKEVALKIYQDLRPVLMTRSNLDDPKNQASEKMTSLMAYFNLSVVTLIDLKALPDGVLIEYSDMILQGCSSELKNCLYLKFFSKDPNSSRILVLRASSIDEEMDKSNPTLEQLRSYYRYLLVAYDLRNRVKNFELDFLFAKRAHIYASRLDEAEKSNSEKVSNYERDLIDRIGKTFEIVVNELQQYKTDPKIQEFISRFNPWSYSRLDVSRFNYGTSKILTLAAQTQIYGADGKVNPKLIETIKKSQQEGDKYGPSFTQFVNELKSENDILTKFYFAKENLETENEIFFMVDRLFRGHLLPEDILELWKGAEKQKGTQAALELITTINSYTRIQILRLLKETKAYIKDIYSKAEFSPQSLVQKIVENSRDLFSRWSETLRGLNRLRVFEERAVRITDRTKKPLEDSKKLIDSLPRNIKYLAVYPQMMILSYFLKKLDAVLQIPSWFGVISIPAGTVVNAFFEGYFPPWLYLGNDDVKLNQVELLFAFDYALRSGVFDVFQGADVKSKVTYEEFFKSVIREYLSQDREDLLKAREALDDFKRSAGYNQFSALCDGKKEHEIPYSELGNSIFTGNLSGSASGLEFSNVLKEIHTFYAGGDNSSYAILKSQASTFPKKSMFILQMGQILSDFLKDANYKEEDRKKITDQTDLEIKSLKDELLTYYARVLSEHKKINDCYNDLNRQEIEYRFHLLSQEKAYLEKVYTRMAELVGKKGNDFKETADRIQTDLGIKYDSLEEGPAYRFSKRGFNDRLIERLQKLDHKITVTSIPDDTDLRKSDVSFKVDFLKDNRAVDQKVFVQNAMYHLNGSGNSLTNYMKDPVQVTARVSKLSTMVQMYGAGILLGIELKDRMKASEVMKEAFVLAKMADISAPEKLLLETLGLDGKISMTHARTLFYTSTDARGLFDTIYDKLKDFAKLGNGQTPLEFAREFYDTYTGVGFFVFAPADKIFSDLKASYRPFVKTYDSIFDDFVATSEKCEKGEVVAKDEMEFCKENINITYDLRSDYPVYRSEMGFSKTRKFLSEANQWFHSSRMKTFHEQTADDFKDSAKPITTPTAEGK